MTDQTDIFEMVQSIVDTPVQLNCPSDRGYGNVDRISWPDPTPEQLQSKWFNQIWEVIKTWDISVPEAYDGYCGATGNHVVAILNALSPVDKDFDENEQWR